MMWPWQCIGTDQIRKSQCQQDRGPLQRPITHLRLAHHISHLSGLCTIFSGQAAPLQDDVAMAVYRDMTAQIKAFHGLQDRGLAQPPKIIIAERPGGHLAQRVLTNGQEVAESLKLRGFDAQVSGSGVLLCAAATRMYRRARVWKATSYDQKYHTGKAGGWLRACVDCCPGRLCV